MNGIQRIKFYESRVSSEHFQLTPVLRSVHGEVNWSDNHAVFCVLITLSMETLRPTVYCTLFSIEGHLGS